jgi:hypothetical protein
VIYRVIRRVSNNDLWAACAIVIYALLYYGQTPGSTAVPESYAGLLGMSIVWFTLAKSKSRSMVWVGVFAAIGFLLKFTLASLILILPLADLLVIKPPVKQMAARWGFAALGFAVGPAALLLYLIAGHATGDFVAMQTFVRGYVGLQWPNAMTALNVVVTTLPSVLLDYYTLLLCIATGGGIALSIVATSSSTSTLDRTRTMVRICTIAFVVMLASVVVEGRYAPFHLWRAFPFGFVIAAYAIARFTAYLRWTQLDRFQRVAVVVLGVVVLLFSPVTRYGWHLLGTVLYMKQGEVALDRHYHLEKEGASFVEARRIGEMVAAGKKDGDELFVASSMPGILYRYAHTVPTSKVLHSAFIKAPWAPDEWKRSTVEYLNRTPRYIIAQKEDRTPDVAGNSLSSLEMLRGMPGISQLLNEHYHVVADGTWFTLFERNEALTRSE